MTQHLRAGLALALVLVACTAIAQQPQDLNPVVVTVNGEPVHAFDVSMILRSMTSMLPQGGQRPSQEQLAGAATQRAVDQLLLAQEARRQGLEPVPARVQQAVSQAEQQSGGREKLEATLARGGADYDDLENLLAQMDVVQVLVDQKIMPTVNVTDEAVKEFYDSNPDYFKRPAQVHARHILFTVEEGAGAEAEAAAKAKAEAALKRARAGEDFAELAKELSEGPSAPRGGDLGFFSQDQMVEPFGEVAFSLEPGQISDLVKTRFGYHIIKVEEKRPAGVVSLDEARPRIEQVLAQQQVAGELEKMVEGLRAKAEIVDQSGGTAPAPATP